MDLKPNRVNQHKDTVRSKTSRQTNLLSWQKRQNTAVAAIVF